MTVVSDLEGPVVEVSPRHHCQNMNMMLIDGDGRGQLNEDDGDACVAAERTRNELFCQTQRVYDKSSSGVHGENVLSSHNWNKFD